MPSLTDANGCHFFRKAAIELSAVQVSYYRTGIEVLMSCFTDEQKFVTRSPEGKK